MTTDEMRRRALALKRRDAPIELTVSDAVEALTEAIARLEAQSTDSAITAQSAVTSASSENQR
jgi:hypothetical protein